MRPSLRPKEERKWVLDTINQYFDVIVEEEDEEPNSEEPDDEDSSDDDSIDSLSEYDDDEMPVEEYEEPNNAGYKSSSQMRSLLSKAASNVTFYSNQLGLLVKTQTISW